MGCMAIGISIEEAKIEMSSLLGWGRVWCRILRRAFRNRRRPWTRSLERMKGGNPQSRCRGYDDEDIAYMLYSCLRRPMKGTSMLHLSLLETERLV